ncbi:MAG: hypothetical protein AB8C13_07010 [Phycisphaerales bacterium]
MKRKVDHAAGALTEQLDHIEIWNLRKRIILEMIMALYQISNLHDGLLDPVGQVAGAGQQRLELNNELRIIFVCGFNILELLVRWHTQRLFERRCHSFVKLCIIHAQARV